VIKEIKVAQEKMRYISFCIDNSDLLQDKEKNDGTPNPPEVAIWSQ
jgi:hypothetical protein